MTRLNALTYNLALYLRLISIQIRSQLQYPASFWLDVAGTGISLATFFVSLALILQRFGNLGGWRLGEIAFLFGLLEASFGVMDMIFAGFDPSNFGRGVRRGTFDQLLLRPVNITLQVLGDEFVLRRIGRIAQGIVIFIIALNLTHIHWTLGKVIYLPFVVLGIVTFFGGLFIIGSTITFWTVESIEVMNIFTYGSSEMISYPMHIYPDWLRSFFTFILPAALLNYYPALYFLDKPDPLGMPIAMRFLSPLAGLLVLLVSLIIWRFGIRHYQSTGT
ncbi:MAG: ABC-2 family transporter protein [Caldilineaceae bacterium]|nr:ABC-2 family transporter protein [Caldilineaceae bacterium]